MSDPACVAHPCTLIVYDHASMCVVGCSLGESVLVFGYPFFVAMTWFCFPFFVLKQTISVVQLLSAIHKIAEYDTANPTKLPAKPAKKD